MKAVTRIIIIEILAVLVVGIAYGSTPFVPNDPLYPQQWNLALANVPAAWLKGWTGAGVRIGIAESAEIEGTHPDLASNYNPDFNLSDGGGADNEHATEVAGVAAAKGGNGLGVTGTAPDAGLVSLDILDFQPWNSYSTYDAESAQIVEHRNDAIAVKNWSFGLKAASSLQGIPDQRFIAMPLYAAALVANEANGAINVRSAMNDYFDANFFGDRNVFGQIVVSAVTSLGKASVYSDYGANLTVAAPSDPASGQSGQSITTTTVGASYASDFGGTSAAAPLVSGVLALAKQAQPRLNTRFAKHVLALTSQMIDPLDDTRVSWRTANSLAQVDPTALTPYGTWRTNAAGIHFNNLYGFGLVDAEKVVDASQQYTGVTALETCTTGNISVGETIPEDGVLTRSFSLPAVGDMEDMVLDYSITGQFHSSIEMVLTSPSGMTSVLTGPFAGTTPLSTSTRAWSALTNAFWGENSSGTWTLTMRDLPFVSAVEMADQITWNSFGITARFGSLIPAEPGDFNADGVVDAADYMKWRDNFGSTTSLAADDSGNGIVDAADYVIWRAHVGSGIGSVVAVPEPQAVFLLAGSSMLLVRRLRRTKVTLSMC